MSLTKTAHRFKKGAKILLIVVSVYYLMILIIIPKTRDFILDLLVDRNPPNPAFGILDPLKFYPTPISDPQPIYVLNTKNGRLPAGMPKKMNVFKFKGIQYSYLSGKGSQTDATLLGFKESELVSDLKGEEFKWQSLESGGILTINTKTQALHLETDMYGKAAEYVKGNINNKIAIDKSIEILRNLNRIDDFYLRVEPIVTLAVFSGNSLYPTKVGTDAQLARVDLFRKIKDVPVYGPDPKVGLLSVILRNPIEGTHGSSPYNYPVVDIRYWAIDEGKTDASYPIITVKEAWQNVSQGKGIVANVTPKNSNRFVLVDKVRLERVLISDIYLAFYETPEFQRYLQPIWVFSGKYTTTGTEGGEVTIYYPALTTEYTRH